MAWLNNEIVVVLSPVDWSFPCDFAKQISLELAKRAKVVFFKPVILPTIRQIIFEKERAKSEQPPKKENIYFFPSIGILPFQRFKLIRKVNLFLNCLLFYFLFVLKFGLKKPVFWGFYYDLTGILPFLFWRKLFIYDRIDQYASLDAEEDKKIKQSDRQLLESSDWVFTNSPYALKYIKRYNQKAFLTPWGCNLKLFSKKVTVLPAEIRKIKKPRLGIVGHFDHRLNLEILNNLAKKREDWSFVLVGPVYNFDQRWKKVEKLPNIYFLGKKPKEKIPAFIDSFDVCLILYDVSQEFCRGCNPMKLYEYLTMGKPVVSTPIEAVRQYFPLVKIADNAREFEKEIAEFLKIESSKTEQNQRKKIARENSWEEKIRKMDKNLG